MCCCDSESERMSEAGKNIMMIPANTSVAQYSHCPFLHAVVRGAERGKRGWDSALTSQRWLVVSPFRQPRKGFWCLTKKFNGFERKSGLRIAINIECSAFNQSLKILKRTLSVEVRRIQKCDEENAIC